MRIEIISNINMDSLKFYLKEHELLSSCAFGNYMIDLLDEQSKLYDKHTDVVICFLDMDTLNEQIDDVLSALLKLKKANKTVFINTLCANPSYIDTYTHETALKEMQNNLQITQFAKENALLVLDFNAIVKRLGYAEVFSEKYWYMGKIKYSAKAFEKIGQEISAQLQAKVTSPKKCLVLDMDNTLWGGVIGEGEIELGNDGIGFIYQSFQQSIKRLKDFGVILAINSKNNMEDALEGLNHGASILKPEDFILIKANWEHKSQNIKEIARELNIGEDSLVFIDDNPVERELISQTTNAVVPNFPEDIFDLNEWFIQQVVYPYFYKLEITSEDSNKQLQYQAKLKRDEVEKSMDYSQFIKTLDIKLEFYINDANHLQRMAQLTQKTNQFNMTTKRYSVENIQAFIDDEKVWVIAVEYQDKYAKEGIIGLAIVKTQNSEAIIDTLLLSCRVLKRDVEKALIEKVTELTKCKKLIGLYEPTKKNIIAKDTYINQGFTNIDDNRFEKEL